jgi:hypothetical protein
VKPKKREKRAKVNKDEARKGADSASFRRIKEARQILHHSKALANKVLTGTENNK